ncbi:MAG: Ig domain-containing protein [Myxococcota bacterium]
MRAAVGLSLVGLACGGPADPGQEPLVEGKTLQIIKTTLPNAQVGTMYEAIVTAEGGSGVTVDWKVIRCCIAPGLGLDAAGISPTQTRIRGVPRETGSFDFRIEALDAEGSTASARFTLNVLPGPPNPVIVETQGPGRVGEFFVARFEATGVVASSYLWRLNSGVASLAAGLQWVPGSPEDDMAEIRGTPEEGGLFQVELQVQTGTGFDTLRTELDIRYPELAFETQDLPDGQQGEAYLATIRVGGGAGRGIMWSLGSSPPNGLRLDTSAPAATTTLSGTPSGQGQTDFDVIAADPVSGSIARKTFSILVAEGRPPLRVLTAALPPAAVQTPYDQRLDASGGTPPYEWSVQNQLPPDLVILNNRLVGTPSREASVDLDLQVRDATGAAAQRTIRLEIGPPELSILSDILPDGKVDEPYEATILTRNGPSFGLIWYPGGGDIPPGLQLRSNSSPNGVIFGTPLQAGVYEFGVVVLDPGTNNRTDRRELKLTIVE